MSLRIAAKASLALLLLSVACGPTDEGSRPLPFGASADEVVEASREAMASLTSYRFKSETEVDAPYVANDRTVQREQATLEVRGEWGQIDRYRFTLAGETTQEWLAFGDRWLLLDGDEWRELPPNPIGVPRFRGRPEIRELDSVAFTGGVNAGYLYQIKGQSTVDEFGGVAAVTFTVTLAIDKRDLLVRRSQVTMEGTQRLVDGAGSFVTEEPFKLVETIDYTGHNLDVAIDVPDGFDLSEPSPIQLSPTATR